MTDRISFSSHQLFDLAINERHRVVPQDIASLSYHASLQHAATLHVPYKCSTSVWKVCLDLVSMLLTLICVPPTGS